MTHDAASSVTATSQSSATALRTALAIASAVCVSLATTTALRRCGAVVTASGSSSATATALTTDGASSFVRGTSNATANQTLTKSARGIASGAGSVIANAGTQKALQGAAIAKSTASANGELIRIGLTICDVVRDILLCWGIEQPCAAPQMAKTAALNILNNAMQVLWNQAKDRNYWTQSTIEVSFLSGVSTAVLSNEIQNVIGPARLTTGQPLVALSNISESETFSNAFLEDASPTTPVGYFIERNNQSGADPVRCTMIISPTPSANTTVKVDVVNESPRYTVLDLVSCPLCPVPHKYVESILMPVCRYLSMHSYLFSDRNREKAIVAAYTDARRLLDVADPLPGQSGENIGYRKEERDKS